MTEVRTVKKLRTIAPSFVVRPPSGTSIRTRLHPTTVEAVALRRIGQYLGSLYRQDLVARGKIGVVPAKLNLRKERKQALTAATSSRWAGSITRAAEDQYQLGMRALTAECDMLATAIRAIVTRLAVPLGTTTEAGTAGYRSVFEHRAKTVRRRALETRFADATSRRLQGSPTIVLGGKRLWSARQNLAVAGLSETQWRTRWDAARMFLTADGESGAPWGNQTIRVETGGILAIKIPAGLNSELNSEPGTGTSTGTRTGTGTGTGGKLRLSVPVVFSHRTIEWEDRVRSQSAIRYDISFDADKDRWYVTASWGYPEDGLVPPLDALQSGRIIGVDLNADHLTAGIVDQSGNPVGVPSIIALQVAGLPASTRDGHLRQTITTLLDQAVAAGASAIAIENLNFTDARTTGRETMGRGHRGKRFRRTVAGIPTGQFRDRLTAMAANRGIFIIAVDPAYTSRWGGQHWMKPLQQRTSDHTATRHQAAAVAIGRRAHGHRIKRKADGTRTQQRMRPTPPQLAFLMKPVTGEPVTGLPRHQPLKLTG
jgi:hypothetical protein